MSIRTNGTILSSTLYSKTWKDDLFNELHNYVYSIGKFKQLTDKGKLLRSIGRDDIKVYEELFFYKVLIDYLINIREALLKSTDEDPDELLLTYDLICVRKNLFCKYKNTNIFDRLVLMANLSLDGINFMQIGCLQETLGDELIVNGDFSSGGDVPGFAKVDRAFPFSITDFVGYVVDGLGMNLAVVRDEAKHVLCDVVLEEGESYQIEIEVTSLTAGESVFLYQSSDGLVHVLIDSFDAVGSYTITYTATRDRISFYSQASDFFGENAYISAISVKKIIATDVCSIDDNPFIIN